MHWLVLLGFGSGLVVPSPGLEVPQSSPERAPQFGPWLHRTLDAHPATEFRARAVVRPNGGTVWLVRQWLADAPIAGARLAVRVDVNGTVRGLTGAYADRGMGIAESTFSPEWWWPTDGELVPAISNDDVLQIVPSGASQTRVWTHAQTGSILAREPLVDDIDITIRGWMDNPLTTPEVIDHFVTVIDTGVIVMENDQLRVLHCAWDSEIADCNPVFHPAVYDPADLPMNPPPLDDPAGHASPTDAYASMQMMQFGSRFYSALQGWGWDPDVWQELGCETQMVDPADCRLIIHTNVLAQDELGVTVFPSAFFNRRHGIFMGQGKNSDTAFDGDVAVHEIGHHVTWGFGSPEPTDTPSDVAFLRSDRGALNESSSDFWAWQMGHSDRIYDYFSAIEPGWYVDYRIRDVSIPFRCPQNLTGEVHMDGRIWVSALRDIDETLHDTGIADDDDLPQIYLPALATIRQIPLEESDQFSPASAIVVDEIEIALGPDAAVIAQEIFDERGLSGCERVLDLAGDPSMDGGGDPEDPIDVRFLVLDSHPPETETSILEENPKPPAVQYRVTLGDSEGGMIVRYRPAVWRPLREPEQIVFETRALVSLGAEAVLFELAEDGEQIDHAADLEFVSEEDPDDPNLARIMIVGLEAGETYVIALVSGSAEADDTWVMEGIHFEMTEAPPPAGTSGGSTSEGEADDSTGDGQDPSSDAESGCGCRTTENGVPPPTLLWALGLGLGLRRRRSGVTSCPSRTDS